MKRLLETKKLDNQKGFTLIEVLVALTILSMSLAGLLRLMMGESSSQVQMAARFTMLRQAQLLMDDYLTRPNLKDGLYKGKQANGLAYVVRVEDLGSWDVIESEPEEDQDAKKKKNRPLIHRAPRLLGMKLCLAIKPEKKSVYYCLECDRVLK